MFPEIRRWYSSLPEQHKTATKRSLAGVGLILWAAFLHYDIRQLRDDPDLQARLEQGQSNNRNSVGGN